MWRPHVQLLFTFFFVFAAASAASDQTSKPTATQPTASNPPSSPSAPSTPKPTNYQQGLLTLVQPYIPWNKQERFKIGDPIRFEWTFDKNTIEVPKTLGFALFAVGNPQKVVIISLVQPNQNFTWASSTAKVDLTEGDYVLKIWDSTDGADEKTGPNTIAPPGRMRVEQGKTLKFYRSSHYVNDPNYCPTCDSSAGALGSHQFPLFIFIACWALHAHS